MIPVNGRAARPRRHRGAVSALALVLALATASPVTAKDAPAAPAGPAHCRQLAGMEREACARCEGQGRSAFSERACKEGVRIAYCAKRLTKDDPDCRVARNGPGNL